MIRNCTEVKHLILAKILSFTFLWEGGGGLTTLLCLREEMAFCRAEWGDLARGTSEI